MCRLITLETGKDSRLCRVYHLRWDVKQLRTTICYYTFPVKDVRLISLDQVYGSVAMASGNCITVWKNLEEPICILKVHTGWKLKCLSIYGNYLGYASDIDVRILRLKPASKTNNKEKEWRVFWGVSHVENDDLVQVRFQTETHDLVPSPAAKTNVPRVSVPVSKRATVKVDQAYDVIGETPNVDHPTFVNKLFIDTCTNLLHKHYIDQEEPRSIHFLRNISQKSDFQDDANGMRLVIATSKRGSLYDLQPLNLISEFEFTNQNTSSVVNNTCLFVMNDTGIEVWSLGGPCVLLRFHPFIGLKSMSATNQHVALLSKFKSDESVSIAAYYNQNSNEPVYLSDMRQVDKIATMGSNGLNMITSLMPIFSGRRRKSDKQEAVQEEFYSYNVYILDMVELCEMYEDIVDKATDVEESDFMKYFVLLKEAHTLLQCKYYSLLREEESAGDQDSSVKLRISVELFNYTTLLQRSFGTLGDVYIKLQKNEKAAQCYIQSERTLAQVVDQLSGQPQFLLSYLRLVLFQSNQDHNKLLQDESTGDLILKVFSEYSPNDFSQALLESSVLQKFSRSGAITLLNKMYGENQWWLTRPKDAFLLGLLYVDLGALDKASMVFSEMDDHLIVDFCVQFKDRVFRHHTSLQKFLLDTRPECFVEIFVRLFEGNSADQIEFDSVFKMFTHKKDSNMLQYFIGALITKVQDRKSELFAMLCEKLFSSYLFVLGDLTQSDASQQPKPIINKSSEELETSQINEDDDEWATFRSLYMRLVDNRYDWLDDCTPFVYQSDLDQVEGSEQVPPIFSDLTMSQQALVGAQSLLSFLIRDGGQSELFNKINKTWGEHTFGRFSLKILCLVGTSNIDSAVYNMVNNVNAVKGLFAFALEHCNKFPHWSIVSSKLLDVLKKDNLQPEHVNVAKLAYEQVLWHMASSFEPNQLLSTLPKNGSLSFFSKYLNHCYSCQCSRDCANRIRNPQLKE
ncbi:Hps3 [Acrasis kona]|uniref:Hps3 n=1 Tax=Acrasis kona TaxID=1008807 RepID=A0AAW2Z5W1_9EUKA